MIVGTHATRDHGGASHRKIAIHNVRVFNGDRILSPRTVIIDGAVIGVNPIGAKHIDGKGQFLLPGLIDTHCHPSTEDDLRELTSYGVTTAFIQSGTSLSERASLMNHHGLTDLRFASDAAVVANSASAIPPFLVKNWITSEEDARIFVANHSARLVVPTSHPVFPHDDISFAHKTKIFNPSCSLH